MSNLDEFVLVAMPHFVAVQYQRLLEAASAEQKVRCALRVYELGLRVLSLGVVSQYLIRDADRVSNLVLNELLLTKLPNATLGTWQQILFTTLRAYEGQRNLFFMPELYDFFWDSSTTPHSPRHDVEAPFTRLTQIRNDLEYGTLPTDEAAWQSLCTETLELLYTVLSQFAFFENYDLIRITDQDNDLYWYDRYTGQQVVPAQTPLKSQRKLNPGWFYLSKQNRDFLRLHPLLVFWEDLQAPPSLSSPPGETAIYDHFIQNRLQYLIATLWKTVTSEKAVTDFVRLLYYSIEQVKLERQQAERLTWWQLREVAWTISERRMASVLGKYHAALFLQRDRAKAAFEAFLASDKVCFVLTGKSGVGKSNFLLALAEEYRRERSDISLFMYNGAKLNPEESLTSIIGRDFDKYLRLTRRSENRDTANIWREIARIDGIEARTVILFIDAINENAQAKALLRQIDELVEGSPWSWLKVVVTSRPEAWRTIKRGVRLAETLYYQEVGEDQLGFEMQSFTRDEAPRAYEKYREVYDLRTAYVNLLSEVRSALQDPLVLRLIADMYQGQEVPSTIKAREVYHEYINHLIRTERLAHEDVRFLERELVPLMIREGHYANTVTALEIDKVRTVDGYSLFELIHNDDRLSNGRCVNQSYINLVDTEILVRYGGAQDYEIRFKYERIGDYFLGKRLFELNRHREGLDKVYTEIIDMITEYPFLWGVVKEALVLQSVAGIDLVTNLVYTESQSVRKMIVAVLSELGKSEPKKVEALLTTLLDTDTVSKIPFPERMQSRLPIVRKRRLKTFNAKRTAIEVAYNLQFAELLEMAMSDPSPSIRSIAVEHTYRLWQRDAENARKVLHILDNLSKKTKRRMGIPNVTVLESCGGLSLLILFDAYKDQETARFLQQLWQHILRDILYVGPEKTRAEWIKTRIRELILRLSIKLVTRISLGLPGNSASTIPDLSRFFLLDQSERRRLLEMLPYLDPLKEDIDSIRDTLLWAGQSNDMLTMGIMRLVLVVQGMTRSKAVLPYIEEVFDIGIKVSPTPRAPAEMMWTLVQILFLGRKNGELLKAFKRLLERYIDCTKGKTFAGSRTYTSLFLFGYPVLYYMIYQHLETEFHTHYLQQAMAEGDIEFLNTYIREMSTGILKAGYWQLALRGVEPLARMSGGTIQQSLIDLLARIRLDHPDAVDDFLEVNEVPQAMTVEVRTATVDTKLGEILDVKMGRLLLEFALIESSFLREQFAWGLAKAVECKDIEEWLILLAKRLLNLISGVEVFKSDNSRLS